MVRVEGRLFTIAGLPAGIVDCLFEEGAWIMSGGQGRVYRESADGVTLYSH